MQEQKPAFDGKPFPMGTWNLAIPTLLLLTVRMGRKDLPPATPTEQPPVPSSRDPLWSGQAPGRAYCYPQALILS